MSWASAEAVPEPEAEAEATQLAENAASWQLVVRRFRRNRAAMVGLAVLAVIVLAALIGPAFAQSTTAQNPNLLNTGPSAAHWLGTDDLGRDVLARVLAGARVSLQVSVQVVLFALLVAIPLGLVAGYVGRWFDSVTMRVMDALFTFPPLTIALAVSALLGPNLLTVSLAIAVVFVPGFVRIIRAQVLAVREEGFVEASRSVGVGPVRMIRRHIFPNVASPLIVQVALSFGYALLAEAGLSFLGFGVQPPNASWGTMLQSAYNFVLQTAWPMIPPGLAIVITVLAFNLIGDGLRDALGRDASRGLERR